MNGPVISFVVAARDEADSVVALHGEIEAAMREVGGAPPAGGAWELIFVDDGSTDATFERVRELHARHPQVRAIRFTQNFGKSAALTAGFEAARGDIVITLDGDLQDDPREIPRFLAALDEGFDLVSGWKRTRRDPLGKRVASRIFNWSIARLTGLRLHDINCGFKAYRAEVTRGLRLRHGLHRFIPFLAKARGFRIGEIVVAHRARVHGRSKYGWERIPQALVDVHLAWLAARGIERPLPIFGPVGVVLVASSAVLAGASMAAGRAVRWPWAAIWVLAGLVGIYILVMALLTARALAREPEGASYSVAERLD